MKLVDEKQKKKIQDEQKRDVALYFVEDGEVGFNPAHNKWVIEHTIQKAKLNKKKRANQYNEQLRERADAVATYVKSRAAEGSTPVEKYFGKRWMSYLRGEKIIQVLKNSSLYGKKKNLYLPGN